MKYVFLGIVILISSNIYSQKTLNAVLLKKGSKDSLKVEIIVETNLFDKTSLDELSIYKTVRIINEDDKNWLKEDWIKTKEIDYLEFKDFKGTKRVFVTPNYETELKKIDSINIVLYERLLVGKISWYRRYSPHGYVRITIGQDHFIKEGRKKPISVHSFTTHKKQLIKLTKDRPDLVPKINDLENDEDIFEILEIYNDKKTNANSK